VIVSDWNGYRDSISDGEVGYLIPTTMPLPGLGGDLAYRHAMGIDSYDRYIGYVSSTVSVDFEALVAACVRLIESPNLRLEMGEKGRQVVKSSYDWSSLIPTYEDLWSELSSIRAAQKATVRSTWPARKDPYDAFSHYPSHELSLEDTASLVRQSEELSWERYQQLVNLEMVSFSKVIQLRDPEVKIIFRLLSSGSKTIAAITNEFDVPRRAFIVRGINVLVKLNLLRLRPQNLA